MMIQTTGRYSCSCLQLIIIPLRHTGKVAYSSTHSYRQYQREMSEKFHDPTA
jgi:hypothetical protein